MQTKQTKKKIFPHSQFLDVTLSGWADRACGIVGLKMVMDALRAESPGIDELIKMGIGVGAYEQPHGWKHRGLAEIARRHALIAAPYDWTGQQEEVALKRLADAASQAPCLTSIHRNFDPQNGGHIIVIEKVSKQWVFYHEPAAQKRNRVRRKVPVEIFLRGWKKRGVIVKH